MRVTYDVSILGAGFRNQVNRTGTFRAVERLAHGLVASKECDVRFSATVSARVRRLTRAHLEQEPGLRRVPLVAPGRGEKVIRRMSDPVLRLDLDPTISLPARIARKLLSQSLRVVETGLGHGTLGDWVDADVFHSPSAPLPRWSGRGRPPARFLTVHDLIPVLFPHLFEDRVARQFRAVLRSLEPDTWVLCNSLSTRDDLCTYLGMDPARVFVTPFAAAPEQFYLVSDLERIATVRRKYGIPDAPYILSLNTLEPRKNMDHAIRSFARLVQEEGVRDLYFVLAGTKGWHFEKIFQALSEAGVTRDRIVLTGYVADEDLAALYSGALAFVYPSLYEGFGLPPLEAMQCGVPVITSNTSSLPEVVGDAGIMLDPADADGLSQAMLELCRNPSLREEMSQRSLQRARQFSWKRCTQDTIAAYRTALAS